MAVYTIHFDERYKHAQHYTGYLTRAANLERRMRYHVTGNGARLMRAVTQAGIGWTVVLLDHIGDQRLERRLKIIGHPERRCPACKGEPYTPIWRWEPSEGAN